MNRRILLQGLAIGAVAPGLLASTHRTERVLEIGEARGKLTIHEGALSPTRERVAQWAGDCCKAVADWYGRFPVPSFRVDVYPVPGRGVHGGRAWGGSNPRVQVSVGHDAVLPALYADWVAVHELVHLALPNLPRAHHWLEEGLSTYVEPWVRVGAGQLSAEKAWYDLVVGLPQGQPQAGDRGLDHTPTWGRTYWGGALYSLLADLELRRAHPDRGLRQALIGILDAGGSMAVSWPIARTLAAGDRAVSSTALTEVYQAHRDKAVRVDLDGIWAELGVIRDGRTVRFDDDAPGAAIRRAIDGTTGH